MVKLPGANDPRPIPQSRQGIARVPESAFSVQRQLQQSGAELSAIARDLKQVYDQEKKRIDTAQVEDYFNQLKNKQIDLSIGEDGFIHQKGENAIKKPVLKDWMRKFDDAANDIYGNLQNDEQRSAFKRRADISRSQYMQDIIQHVNRENGFHQKQVMGATLDTEKRTAGLRWSNPNDVAASLERSKYAVNSYATANGISGEVLENMQIEAASGIHQVVIAEALANKNPAYAKLYFKAYKDEINPEIAIKMQSSIEEGTLRANAQEKTDQLMSRGDSKKALQKAREIKDPELRDNVVTRIKSRIQENKAIQAQQEAEAEDEAWKIIVEGKNRDDIPPDLWTDLSGESRKKISDYLIARDTKAERKEDDWQKLDEVDEMIAEGDITETDQLLVYEPYFKDSTFRALRKKVEKRGKISATVMRRSFEDRLGKSRAKWGDSDRENWLAFQDYILNNVQETKRPEDIDSWADKWFMEGYGLKDKPFVDDPNTYGQARIAGREDFLIETPDDVRLEVEKSVSLLKKYNFPVPDEGGREIDIFFTRYYLEASRWLSAHDVPATPSRFAAYAVLVYQNKPIDRENMEYVAAQIK